MIRHGYKGAFELSATVDYLFGYDATTGVVEDWMYEQVAAALPAATPTCATSCAARTRGRCGRSPSGCSRRPTAGCGRRRTTATLERLRDALPRRRGRARGGGARDAPFPFSAIVGQEALREALLACAVDPAIGGVLVRGERGTAKSTAVRGLAPLLPPVRVVAGDRYAADPDLGERRPDGPTPARVVERAGARSSSCRSARRPTACSARSTSTARSPTASARSSPGCWPRRTAGILYVDEVNLLPDHLVDVLLDAAALGRVHVERDGVSRRARRALPARRDDEPRGGRAAPAAARPLRAVASRCAGSRGPGGAGRRSSAAGSPSTRDPAALRRRAGRARTRALAARVARGAGARSRAVRLPRPRCCC